MSSSGGQPRRAAHVCRPTLLSTWRVMLFLECPHRSFWLRAEGTTSDLGDGVAELAEPGLDSTHVAATHSALQPHPETDEEEEALLSRSCRVRGEPSTRGTGT